MIGTLNDYVHASCAQSNGGIDSKKKVLSNLIKITKKTINENN
jgi:hypothetical protein